MTKIVRGTEELTEIYRDKENSTSFLSRFFAFLCREYFGAYIMTIGVVDECRRFGLGTKLLNYTIDLINKMWTSCDVIYLHVVDYNEAAIRFYEKNGFRTLKRMKDHYLIFEKEYDALLLYKDITKTKKNC